MSIRAIFTTSFLLKGIFVLAIFILVFTSGVSYKHTVIIAESTEILVHSYKIQVQLEQLESCVKDAETGERGYRVDRMLEHLRQANLFKNAALSAVVAVSVSQ